MGAANVEWVGEQLTAIQKVRAWLEAGEPQVFRLFGFAGVGKTSLAKHLAEGIGDVAYGAYTGKAARVMQRKGCTGASTIHRMIYRPVVDPKTRKVSFMLNEEAEIRHANLVVVDEVSMVGERIGEDLLSFGVQVLVLGDPAQLPPIEGTGFFTDRTPDVLLTEVHRQSEGSAILDLATRVRQGEPVEFGGPEDCRVLRRGALSMEECSRHDQILVGRNATRAVMNQMIRHQVHGRTSMFPQVGDRLICLRNDYSVGVLNGSQWVVVEAPGEDDDGNLPLTLRDIDSSPFDEDGAEPIRVVAHAGPFQGKVVPMHEAKGTQQFDFAYAITVHKAQGSEWDRVVVFDESACFKEDRRRWLYTAVTRAAKELVVLR